MIDYKKLRSLIEGARKKQVAAQNAVGSVLEAIEDGGVIDLSRFKTDAENADNLEEAIYCYIQYGEFDIDSLIGEIKVAENQRRSSEMVQCSARKNGTGEMNGGGKL